MTVPDNTRLTPRDTGERLREADFSIQEREDDMLICQRHWQFGWMCIARRPKLMTNDEWRPEAARIIEALAEQPASERGGADPWREAVIDGLICAHIYSEAHDADPRKALNDLICWSEDVALDPRVSKRARDLATPHPDAGGALREAQDKRRAALIERMGHAADLMAETPLEGDLGDVAYDLLREGAAQISSDRQHIARLAASEPAAAETGGVEAVPDGMKPWSGGNTAPGDWDGGPVWCAPGAWLRNPDLYDGAWPQVLAYTACSRTLPKELHHG